MQFIFVAVLAATAATAMPARDQSNMPTDEIVRQAEEACKKVAFDNDECRSFVRQGLQDKYLSGSDLKYRSVTETVVAFVEKKAGPIAVDEAKRRAEACDLVADPECHDPTYWISLHSYILCTNEQVVKSAALDAKQCQKTAVARNRRWYTDVISKSYYTISTKGFYGALESYDEAAQYAAQACAIADETCRDDKTIMYMEAIDVCRDLDFPGEKNCLDVALGDIEMRKRAGKSIDYIIVSPYTAKKILKTTPEILVAHKEILKLVTCEKMANDPKLECQVRSSFYMEPRENSRSLVDICASHGGCSECNAFPLVMPQVKSWKRMEHFITFKCDLAGNA